MIGFRRSSAWAFLSSILTRALAAAVAVAASSAVAVAATGPAAATPTLGQAPAHAAEAEPKFRSTASIQGLQDALSGIAVTVGLDPAAIELARDSGGSTAAALVATQGPTGTEAATQPREGTFFRSWLTITSVEVGLLCATAMLPKSWTGWSADFVRQGANHFAEAYTAPPIWDTDRWFHNYLGHPYGGSVYYNTIRSQGGTKTESFLFSALLSTQWEYVFEAVAERPSIQDLIITPVSGRILGELIHRMTQSLAKGGTSPLEKVAITVLNPMYVLYQGF